MADELLPSETVGKTAGHNSNPLIVCPMCGKSSTRQHFNPELLDPDIYFQEMHGLGRGKGFYAGERWSVLDNPEVTYPVKERLIQLLQVLKENGITDDEEILDRIGIEREVVVQQEQKPAAPPVPRAPPPPPYGVASNEELGIASILTPTEFEDTIRVPGREDDDLPFGRVPISNVSTPVLETMLHNLEESSEPKLRDLTQIPIIQRELEKRNPGVVGQRDREAEEKFQYVLALVRICSGIEKAREHFNDEDPTLFSISLQIAREGLQEAISITSSPTMARRSRYTSKVLETILQSTKDLPMKRLLPNSSSEVQRFLDTTIPKMVNMLTIQLRIYTLMASTLSDEKRRERRKSRMGL